MSGMGIEPVPGTDEEILIRLGYDPEVYEIAHCSHCDRSDRHPSCMIVRRQPECES